MRITLIMHAHTLLQKNYGAKDKWWNGSIYVMNCLPKRNIRNVVRSMSIIEKLKCNYCGGSRPFLKHMEVALEKGKDITIVENWGIMHQHQGVLGGWVNEEAENIGKKMLDELEKEK